jgi:S-adenosylmethionine synthetase
VILDKTASLDEKTKIYINPTGRFVIGGPSGDTGLTAGKSSSTPMAAWPSRWWSIQRKDPSKVDRSAAYIARFVAKNLVANKYCTRMRGAALLCNGVPYPISIYVDTFGTGTIDDENLRTWSGRNSTSLRQASFTTSICSGPSISKCNYGHFGKASMPWEQIINV